MTMTPKKRREARRAAREAAKPLPTARPVAQRSTFRVAQAQRQLAAELPSVVRNRQAERRTQTRAPLDALPAIGQGEAKRSPRRVAVSSTRPEQPKLDAQPNLKCRPKSNKPSSGGGAGRSFVPWNKDC